MLQEATTGYLYTHIKEYAISNQAANRNIINWFKTEAPNLIFENSGFRQTLLHIWQVEIAWLDCLQNKKGGSSYEQTLAASMDEILEGLSEQSEKFINYILSLDESAIREYTHVYIPNILDCRIQRHELLQLCFDHSNFHRAQIIRMASQTIIIPPSIQNYPHYRMLTETLQ